MPEYDPRFEYGWNDYLTDNVEAVVTCARFKGSNANDPERLGTLVAAEETVDARDFEEWRFIVETYPDAPLVAEKLTKYENEDIPVRAYYLGKAIKRLLELIDAPTTMKSDFDLLMSGYTPHGGKKYADVQRAMIERPELSISRLSKECGLDRSTIHKLMKSGILQRPES